MAFVMKEKLNLMTGAQASRLLTSRRRVTSFIKFNVDFNKSFFRASRSIQAGHLRSSRKAFLFSFDLASFKLLNSFLLRIFIFLLLCLPMFVSSCKKTTTTQTKTQKPLYQTTGKEGKIRGVVNFIGNTQTPGKIDMNADAACAAKNPNATVETLKVTNGKLANVLIYIKDGTTADGKKFGELGFQNPDSEAKLDQVGCVYVPRVLGVRTQQKLSIHNSDKTVHTTQASSVKNPIWFTTQQINSAPVVKTFTEAEVMIPLKCSQHGWMAAFVAVFDHPFFSVTKEDGAFEINGLPTGNYTLAAWHERGTAKGTEKLLQVEVKENGETNTDFSFDESSTQVAPGSMIFSAPLELAMPACK